MKKIIKNIYSKTDARYNLPSIVDRVRDGEGPIYITDRETVTAVVISNSSFENFNKKPKKVQSFGS